jgi:NitT/TauT family transport system substrate-binding protein
MNTTSPKTLPILRMNQGDASEARVYYCAHFVAAALDLFEAEGVSVVFTSTASGGKTIQGGQIPAVLSGEADLTIGGPMVTMKNHEDGGPPLVSFCAAVAKNPWFLAARAEKTDFRISDLSGARIIDVANVGTASLCFRWLLKDNGLSEADVTLVPGSGSEDDDLAAVAAGTADYALHSLHALAPKLAVHGLAFVSSLAAPTGAVPWSAYIARPAILSERRAEFAAFTRAIGKALEWIGAQPATAVAALVAPSYADYPAEALVAAINGYQRAEVFAASTAISRTDFEHFANILIGAGWLTSTPPYAALVDTSLTSDAVAIAPNSNETGH